MEVTFLHVNSVMFCSDSGYDGTGIQWKENFDSNFTEISEIGRYDIYSSPLVSTSLIWFGIFI